MLWILLSVVLAILIALIVLYNSLVLEGWSGIAVQLQRRSDLIPNLLATVQGYLTHERDLLNEVTALRARAQSLGDQHPAERAATDGLLGAALGRLIAVAESYPDLKASANVLEFQESLEAIESELQLARHYYNGAARQYNIAVEQFPSNLVAGGFGFEPAELFTLDDPSDAAVPKVSFTRG